MAHVSIVTIGTDDLERAAGFYESMGWRRSTASVEGEIVFLQGGAVVLAIFGRDALAGDARVDPDPEGTYGNVTLAMNLASEDEVDEALQQAQAAGAAITKPPQPTEWGGYSGYFRAPDGHLWEVAHNPGFPLRADGSVALPES